MDAQDFIAQRQALGLSKTALAEALGVTRQTVQNWESGRTEIPKLAEWAMLGLVVAVRDAA